MTHYTSTCFPFRHGRRKDGPALRDVCDQATVVSIKARKSNWHWSTRLRTTLAGPGVHLQGFATDQRTTKAPMIPRRLSAPVPKPSSPTCRLQRNRSSPFLCFRGSATVVPRAGFLGSLTRALGAAGASNVWACHNVSVATLEKV